MFNLPELYQRRYPKLELLFDEFKEFLEHNTHEASTINSASYIQNYYKGVRRDLPYTPFTTSNNQVFLSGDNELIECDNNKSSMYTNQEILDYNLPITNEFSYQNIDFLLLVIPILLQYSSKKDVLKFLFEFYLNEKVEIIEGHKYLGKLDNNYSLDNPRIKFRDDQKFQTFSYIVFHKSIDINETWVYKNIIPLANTIGIHIELVSVNESKNVEYFDSLTPNCYSNDRCDIRLIVSNDDEFYSLNYHDCYDCHN